MSERCICRDECQATEHDYEPILIDEDFSDLYAEAMCYRRALGYIANTNPDPRPDGTYNISREALIKRAQDAIKDWE